MGRSGSIRSRRTASAVSQSGRASQARGAQAPSLPARGAPRRRPGSRGPATRRFRGRPGSGDPAANTRQQAGSAGIRVHPQTVCIVTPPSTLIRRCFPREGLLPTGKRVSCRIPRHAEVGAGQRAACERRQAGGILAEPHLPGHLTSIHRRTPGRTRRQPGHSRPDSRSVMLSRPTGRPMSGRSVPAIVFVTPW